MARRSKKSGKNPVVLITGGAGFLGSALVRELLGHGGAGLLEPAQIRLFDVTQPRTMNDRRLRYIKGDIRSRKDLEEACAGADLVFHCAAVVDWGQRPRSFLHDVNVTGTQNVIDAAGRAGVRALVYTSTMDVLYDGRAITNGDESIPYPKKYKMAYAETKALGEKLVLGADGKRHNGSAAGCGADMRTCVIRPCGMFGEADPYHVSSFIKMAESGRLTFRIGNGKAVFQHVYVGNVAHAHVLAGSSLLNGRSAAAGKAYFITDFAAKNFFDYLEPIVNGIGYAMPPKKRSIPMPVMYAVAGLIEGACMLCKPFFNVTPVVNRTSVAMVCKDLTFCCDRARRDLGYNPRYSEDEAITRTIEYFKEHGPV